jgi:predicted acyl esterase
LNDKLERKVVNGIVFRKGRDPAEAQYPGLRPRTFVDDKLGMLAEYDVAVTMRDGARIYVDVFRPQSEGKHPSIVVWEVYGKHKPEHAYYKYRVGCGVPDSDLSRHCGFEAPDPGYWVPRGYAVIYADPRGVWGSEGDATFYSQQEAQDCYDLIEWVARQAWCNGRVGMSGVSYLAWIQYKVAELNPPHLAAINPWEGASDWYRELATHGGIPCDFLTWLMRDRWSFSKGYVEDLEEMFKRHPLLDDYWKTKTVDFSRITVPAFIVASWSDHGLHTRGTLEVFKRIPSKEKWLRVHGRKKWQDYYLNVELQRKFFDRFLKGIDNDVKYWPKVYIEIRERYYVGNFRVEDDWPIPRTKYTPLYLDASNGTMSLALPPGESNIRYDALTGRAIFDYTFNEKTELTGYMKLRLWVEAVGNDDMDLFVAIDKIDRAGERVTFPHESMFDDGPVAKGWLRVSHREVDEKLSTPWQPVHKHERELKLKPGEVVPVDVEIWPSSTLFRRGEKLRLIVQGKDVYAPWYKHSWTLNKGEHVIYTGGRYDSCLLVPVVPFREYADPDIGY